MPITFFFLLVSQNVLQIFKLRKISYLGIISYRAAFVCLFFYQFFFQEGTQSEVDREKRAFGPDVGFGVKNAVLGYVFGVS